LGRSVPACQTPLIGHRVEQSSILGEDFLGERLAAHISASAAMRAAMAAHAKRECV
jgi:hypothetical protein